MREFSLEEIGKLCANFSTKAPKALFAIGDESLLLKTKIAIVGSRRASQYAKSQSYLLAKAISQADGVVLSGGAMGIDTSAHEGALPNTIAVLANGADIDYPKTNKELLAKIRQSGLVLSEHQPKTAPTTYGFVARNRIIVGLSVAVVIVEAEIDSGSMRSFEWAHRFGIAIYVLPHRLNESSGTQKLLKDGLAKAIYSFDEFLAEFDLKSSSNSSDEIIEFCKKSPSYEEAFSKFGDRLLEYELDGRILISRGFATAK